MEGLIVNFRKKNSIEFSTLHIFLFFSLLGIILFFILAPFLRQKSLEWIVMENNPDYVVTDFQLAELWGQNLREGYEDSEICYPPLALLVFKYISRVTTNEPIICEKWFVIQEKYQLMFLLLYIILPVLWLYRCFQTLEISSSKQNLLMLCIMCSVPMFAGGIEKANIILYIIPMVLTAFILRESNVRIKREIALILIASAASFKIFPAVIGLLYIKEKRWGETIRLLIYGLIMFFLPFVFCGGISGIKNYFYNIILRDDYYGKRFEYFKGLLAFLDIQGQQLKLLYYLFIIALIALIMITKDEFREKVYIASFLCFVPNNAFRYMLLWFLLPIYVLLKNDPKANDASTKLNAFVLGNIFTIPTIWGIVTDFRLNFGLYSCTYVELYVYVFAWCLLAVQIMRDLYVIAPKIRRRNITWTIR